ncbi:MAG: dihydroneopterin aldolase [Alistipes sp.]|jgi:dihydroneopterin aldolase|nr:dihydroneopterin aldolase [Alistipes sp.]MEE0916065.1 dihydroneopterin aldolase [Alistipes sp.]
MSSSKLYTINLEGMEFHAFHGCYQLEQLSGSHFEVSLEITTTLGEVAERDDVTLAVNYLTVYEIVRAQMAITQCTIERVAQNINRALLDRFGQIFTVKCTVTKLAPPLGGKVRRVSVTLTGER